MNFLGKHNIINKYNINCEVKGARIVEAYKYIDGSGVIITAWIGKYHLSAITNTLDDNITPTVRYVWHNPPRSESYLRAYEKAAAYRAATPLMKEAVRHQGPYIYDKLMK